MSATRVKIFATQFNGFQSINVSQDNQIPIEMELVDYEIPEGSTVIAYARGRYSGKTYKEPCTYSGDLITLMPPINFFVPGPNALQVEIDGKIIPFQIDVFCKGRVSGTGNPTTPEPILPYVIRAEMAANAAKNSADAALQASGSAASSSNAALQSLRQVQSFSIAADQSKTSAEESANASEQSANDAAESASDADNSKNLANTAADAAKNSADAALKSAGAAESSNQAALNSLKQIQSISNNVFKAATSASEKAQDAKQYSNEAAGSAGSAKTSADDAKEFYEKTSAIVISTPYIGENGHWYIWSLSQEQYVDSGAESRGVPPSLHGSISEFQIASNGTTIPTGTWLSERPVTPQGQYLWTRITATWATGNVVWYTVDYRAIDGEQSVASEVGLRVVDGVLCAVFEG